VNAHNEILQVDREIAILLAEAGGSAAG